MENNILLLSEDGKTVIDVTDKEVCEVVIPYGVTEIGEDAFKGCRSLQKVDIPDSVTTIGARAFRYCTSLHIVYKKVTTTNIATSNTTINHKTAIFAESSNILRLNKST